MASSCNQTNLDRFPNEDWDYTLGALMAIISCLATFENGTILLIFCKYPSLRTTSNKILMSMVVADFLTGLSVGPLYSAQLLNDQIAYNCDVQMARIFFASVFIGASVASVGFISADRAHHLIKLQNYSMKDKVLYAVLCLCWGIPILIPVIGVLTNDKVYAMLVFLIGLLVILIVIGSYISLLTALQRHRGNLSGTLDAVYLKRQKSAAKTAIMIVTCYIVMLLPLFIEKIMYASKFQFANEFERPILLIFAMMLCIGNSAVNPYIYCARIPVIRKHIAKLFCAGESEREKSTSLTPQTRSTV